MILFKGPNRKLTVFKYDKKQNSRFVKPEYALKILPFRLKRLLLLIDLGSNLTFYDILTSYFWCWLIDLNLYLLLYI